MKITGPYWQLALIALPALIQPAGAEARDLQICADLYRKLHSARQIIGNSSEIRGFAQSLAQKNIDIRRLRVEMHRSGCGGGSIVVIGADQNPACEPMREEQRRLEAERDEIAGQRNEARARILSQDDREVTLAAIRQNECLPTDLAEQEAAEEKERLRVRGIELPKDDGYSGVTKLTTPADKANTRPVQKQAAAQPPTKPGPERPYDPDRQVRTVGPLFLPEKSLDLANPKLQGPQPLQ